MPLIQFNVRGIKKTAFFSFIPKTGGTALIQAFRNLGARIYLHEENNPVVGVLRCPSQHFEYKLSSSIIDISAADHAFTIVRHPFERAKSDYKWGFRNVHKTNNIPYIDEWITTMIRNYENNPYIFDNHIRPQIEFIGEKITNVYHYESGLDEILQNILTKMKLKPRKVPVTVPRKNIGTSVMSNFLDEQPKQKIIRARSIIEKFYEKDYEILRYT